MYLSALTHADFDHLLWSCDLNFVRGEDSLVRAILAGQPFLWQIYPQDDNAHVSKLEAFLDWLDAPDSLRQVHTRWNRGHGSTAVDRLRNPQSTAAAPHDAMKRQFDLSERALQAWRECTQAARAKTMSQADLATQLLGFVAKEH